MKSKKNLGTKVAAIATGTLALGALSANVQANELFQVQDLGSGAELRSELIQLNNPMAVPTLLNNSDIELKCGEGKCGEGKCGEAKDGEDKKADKKADESKEGKAESKEKADEGKTKEHKCGEGKCGEGKCGTH